MAAKLKDNRAEEVCSFAICLSRKLDPVTFVGRMKGRIIKPQKTQRSQWDQVFVPDGFNKTVSEMNLEEMGSVNHRAQALNKFVDFLIDNIDDLIE